MLQYVNIGKLESCLFILHVILVHISPILDLSDSIRFNMKVVESWVPGFEVDSDLYTTLINFD